MAQTHRDIALQRGRIDVLTLVVAFCSLVYELIFSQTLTLLFGQTVTRYSLTIGIYLFCLGLGALAYARIGSARVARVFFAVEATLAVVGPLGVLSLYWVNAGDQALSWRTSLLIASHLPIVVVGLLSGLEIPLLAALHPGKEGTFYRVLGWDYLGSLLGAVAFALWLYPRHGLIAAALSVGFLNACAAAWFFVSQWPRRRVGVAACAVGLAAYGGVLSQSEALSDAASRHFTAKLIEQRFDQLGVQPQSIEIREHFNTRYQQVTLYDVRWPGQSPVVCLDLDGNIQFCERGIGAYHHGLIDVPMAHLPEARKLKILMIGGGDFIAVNYLRPYLERIEHVDLVDIDPEFMGWARQNPSLSRYHERAWLDARLSLRVVVEDGFQFLRHNREVYDLVILDLPGLTHDKLMPLYSVEFFRAARRALTESGLVVTWTYLRRQEPIHRAVLHATLHAAGFTRALSYAGVGTDQYAVFLQESFLLLPRGEPPRMHAERSTHVARFRRLYQTFTWESFEPSAIAPNSVFAPNPRIVVPLRRGT